ncbi:dihydroxyacetone kinase DhaK subunit [Coriobacterium glomerans PW2]|uniref:Dihydroxyacetone kinase DhaK subunit n=1 Tax=Coriobacterium glomerans (strain ATCC 49209 / DSM 20642 / JCM 10262 / PW2) TaxID=700015 RepID=F2N7D1_CORGP|nr:dihydroxyacetone kinase subunit DhaK [Coriobacterium glomerans]AEB06606.1 dihydroxyacetone kinase DhaK subunit [Coriobacterium glomerans PW2]
MKKLINSCECVLEEMIEGTLKASDGALRRLSSTNVLVRADAPVKGKVALVSGGGSGHEPAHAGYVGAGMLDAAVCGEVFTSPTPDQVYQAIKAVDSGSGTLLIVKNYTGDVMNFEMAKGLAAAEGIDVEMVVVNDDVAVEDSSFTAGRRGICGTVLVHKCAGAKADMGGSLAEVKAVAEKVIAGVRSMGMATEPSVVPANGKPNFTLADDEIEIGIGIHGEPGTHREKIKSADATVDELLGIILADMDLRADDEVAPILNGMGGTPLMELDILYNHLHDALEAKGFKVVHPLVGNYMTSIEMKGFSITLLKLDEELKELLGYKSYAPAMRV